MGEGLGAAEGGRSESTMKRRELLKTVLPVAALGALSTLADAVPAPPEGGTGRMPVLFIGHGSPMNAVQDNEFSHFYFPPSRWSDQLVPRKVRDIKT